MLRVTKTGLQETVINLPATQSDLAFLPAKKVAEMNARLCSTMRELEVRSQKLAEALAECQKLRDSARKTIARLL